MAPPADNRSKDSTCPFNQIQQSQEIRSSIQKMSHLLNTGLSHDTLDICIQLCEAGINPQALADIIQQIRNEIQRTNQ